MRTRIKVADLTLRQFVHLQENLRTEYEIPENAVRVRVEFEVGRDSTTVEMPVRAFVALMTRLQRIEVHGRIEEGTADLPALPARWSAPMTPVSAPVCKHGSPVKDESPSVFDGADPVRTFEDGCFSVGPYRPLGIDTVRTFEDDT